MVLIGLKGPALAILVADGMVPKNGVAARSVIGIPCAKEKFFHGSTQCSPQKSVLDLNLGAQC
jgi:hypothetical protein